MTPRPTLSIVNEKASSASRLAERQLESGPGGPHDPGMEARVAKLESDVEHIKSDVSDIKRLLESWHTETVASFAQITKDANADFRQLLYAGAAATLLVLGVVAHGFHWL